MTRIVTRLLAGWRREPRCLLLGHRYDPNARWVLERDTPLHKERLDLWVFHVCGRCGRRRFTRDSGLRWHLDLLSADPIQRDPRPDDVAAGRTP